MELIEILVITSAAASAWLGVRAIERIVRDTPQAAPGEPALESREEAAMGPLSRLAAPEAGKDQDSLRKLLNQAGLRHPSAMVVLVLSRAVFTVLLPSAWLIFSAGDGLLKVAAGGLLAAAAGYYGPHALVNRIRSQRQDQLSKAMPDAMDMLVSCLEAGLGLDAAMRFVARELGAVSPVLAREIDQFNKELAAGMSRSRALQRLDERTGIEELSSLVAVLGQAERMGAGIATIVRPHARMSRKQRMLAAEARAAEASPRITVVMILFVLPALFVVILGPTMVQIIGRLMPVLGGQS